MYSFHHLLRKLSAFLAASQLIAVTAFSATQWDAEFQAKIAEKNPKLNPIAIRKAFKYFSEHLDSFDNKNYLSIVNFDQPWDEKRLYIVDLKSGETSTYWVTHGMESRDRNDWKIAKYFSNTDKSHKSSLGFYRTYGRQEKVTLHVPDEKEPRDSLGLYFSKKHGWSLRLKGLQSTNSNALNREIVIHCAYYVSEKRVADSKTKPNINLSHGCPAVDCKDIDLIIDRLEGHSLYYIYKTPEPVEGESTPAPPVKTPSKPKSEDKPIGANKPNSAAKTTSPPAVKKPKAEEKPKTQETPKVPVKPKTDSSPKHVEKPVTKPKPAPAPAPKPAAKPAAHKSPTPMKKPTKTVKVTTAKKSVPKAKPVTPAKAATAPSKPKSAKTPVKKKS